MKKAAVTTCCRPLFFFFSFFSSCLLPYFPPHRPYARVFFLSFLFLYVKQQLSFSCCFVRATTVVIFFVLFCLCNTAAVTGICSSPACMVFLWQLQPSPSFRSCITFSRTPTTCRLFCYVFFLLTFFLFSFFLFSLFVSWSGLFCCVLVPGTLALHLLCLLFFFYPPADRGKQKLKLTTLPCIFIHHVVCRFTSIAFAVKR